ncbi:MAG: leucyl aminopeptidase [Actinomycetota bacterium]|nr:leucyl aminopeptidase [Actinomycetota bacterium]
MPTANTASEAAATPGYHCLMTVPALSVSSRSPADLDVDVLVIGVRKTDSGPLLLSDDERFAALADSLVSIGIGGGQDEVRRLPAMPGIAARSLALVGVGATLGANELRYAAGSAARQVRGATSLGLALPAETPDDLLAILEGAAIGAYSYLVFRSPGAEPAKTPATKIVVVGAAKDGKKLAEQATILATAIHTVRDLVNAPASHLFPESFAQEAVELAAEAQVVVEVLGEKELLAGDFGGIIGVGKGSSHGPRLVKVSYSPAGATRHLALVGKGITFDSGGISLKPPASMVGMKFDMTGAATVLAVTLAASRMGIPLRMTAWLCIAENMPGGSAIKPNDVLHMKGGKTVEVLNTDAEGRLVMADGIVAASDEHPDAIIDVATLTGAQVVALGNRYAGVMGDDALVDQLVGTAKRVGETFWPMPLPAEVRTILSSDVADIANSKPGNTAAGMLAGGVFLAEFVGTNGEGDDRHTIPWAHIDIAGPADNKGGGYGFVGRGPTGVTVRALLALAREFSAA